MSRSFRRSPFMGCTGARSEKEDKRHYNRAIRHKVRQLLHTGEEDIFPLLREMSNVWSMDKDGKFFFGDWDSERKKESPWPYYSRLTKEEQDAWDADRVRRYQRYFRK